MLASVSAPPSIRLFVAVVPPAEAVDHLTAALPNRAAVGDSRARWTHSADWHLTLVFLGWVRPDGVAAVERAVAAGVAAADGPPPELALSGAGHFGRRVLWIGVTGDDLDRLAAAARSSLERDEIAYDPKPLHPHLTLARGERLRVPADLLAYAGPSWPASEVRLMRSVPGQRAPRYATVGQWPVVAG